MKKLTDNKSNSRITLSDDELFDKERDKYIADKHSELEKRRKQLGDDKFFYNQVLEFIKISNHDFERRSKEYWEMFYKAIFAVAVLLSLPYFILSQPELSGYSYLVIIFPVLSSIFSVFALYYLPRVHDKNLKYILHARALSTYLCSAFVEPDFPILTLMNEKYVNSLKTFRASKSAIVLFVILLCVSALEIVILLLEQLKTINT
jgi:uncharacterized membrane protein